MKKIAAFLLSGGIYHRGFLKVKQRRIKNIYRQ